MSAPPSHYGATAKVFHWLIVALLLVQIPLGWWMERSPGSRIAGTMIHLHMSIGFTILAVIAVRLIWKLAHPVAAEPTLTLWQRWGSEAIHWLLYALVFATAITGWLFATSRGWTIIVFWTIPLPHLTTETSLVAQTLGPLHVGLIYSLMAVTAAHVSFALGHWLLLKDGVMQRMMSGR